MKKTAVLTLLAAVLVLLAVVLPLGAAVIVDHRHTDLARVPAAWLDQARAQLRVTYGHTSHGSQLVTGHRWPSAATPALPTISPTRPRATTPTSSSTTTASPAPTTWAAPDRTAWATATRALLNRSGGCNRNVVIWSWCGQADAAAADIQLYLDLMNALEGDFPAVKFVYMTGHLVGSGSGGQPQPAQPADPRVLPGPRQGPVRLRRHRELRPRRRHRTSWRWTPTTTATTTATATAPWTATGPSTGWPATPAARWRSWPPPAASAPTPRR